MRSILVVDDEPDLVEVIQFYLEDAGFKVAGCTSGASALTILENQEFDCVVSDVRMPIMDGVALFHEIRKKFPKMPVVFVSGFADLNSEKIQQMGVSGLISKPAMGETLIDHLKAILTL